MILEKRHLYSTASSKSPTRLTFTLAPLPDFPISSSCSSSEATWLVGLTFSHVKSSSLSPLLRRLVHHKVRRHWLNFYFFNEGLTDKDLCFHRRSEQWAILFFFFSHRHKQGQGRSRAEGRKKMAKKHHRHHHLRDDSLVGGTATAEAQTLLTDCGKNKPKLLPMLLLVPIISYTLLFASRFPITKLRFLCKCSYWDSSFFTNLLNFLSSISVLTFSQTMVY